MRLSLILITLIAAVQSVPLPLATGDLADLSTGSAVVVNETLSSSIDSSDALPVIALPSMTSTQTLVQTNIMDTLQQILNLTKEPSIVTSTTSTTSTQPSATSAVGSTVNSVIASLLTPLDNIALIQIPALASIASSVITSPAEPPKQQDPVVIPDLVVTHPVDTATQIVTPSTPITNSVLAISNTTLSADSTTHIVQESAKPVSAVSDITTVIPSFDKTAIVTTSLAPPASLIATLSSSNATNSTASSSHAIVSSDLWTTSSVTTLESINHSDMNANGAVASASSQIVPTKEEENAKANAVIAKSVAMQSALNVASSSIANGGITVNTIKDQTPDTRHYTNGAWGVSCWNAFITVLLSVAVVLNIL